MQLRICILIQTMFYGKQIPAEAAGTGARQIGSVKLKAKNSKLRKKIVLIARWHKGGEENKK